MSALNNDVRVIIIMLLQTCVVCNECGLGPEQDIAMVLGPKDRLETQP